MIRTIYGWGEQLSGELEMCGINYVKVRLNQNSMCPGQIILAYPVNRILERDE